MTITSCTKDLKDDARKLKEELEKLQAENDELKNSASNTSRTVGLDNPLKVTTVLTDFDNNQVTMERTYKFKASNSTSSYLLKNNDNTYKILIIRYRDAISIENCAISFTYNPSTKAITNKVISQQWWPDNEPSEWWIEYSGGENTAGLTREINIESIDLTTGEISLTAKASATGEYTRNGNGPYEGQPMSTTISYKGKLGVFTRQ